MSTAIARVATDARATDKIISATVPLNDARVPSR
jgi:hypothetical protein